ncbi:MAG: hypothetical protein ACYTF9_07680 [Planctomycetota bacterium]|jgi:hypothetical protein
MERTTRLNPSSAALWASAFVIAALAIVQAGRMQANPAYAGMASSQGDYTLLTASAGRGDKAAPFTLLYVIDSRDQVLLVYEIDDARRTPALQLRDGGSLAGLFMTARQ